MTGSGRRRSLHFGRARGARGRDPGAATGLDEVGDGTANDGAAEHTRLVDGAADRGNGDGVRADTAAGPGDEPADAEPPAPTEVLARVRVPASCANLGPGFDVLAVAVDLPLVVTVGPFDGWRRVAAAGEGGAEVPADTTNLVWRGLRAFCDVFGFDLPDVTLYCENRVPLQRGLGSSAAALVAGLVVARALVDAAVADQDVIDLATQLEGHADNVAAAVLGGLVVAGPSGPARRFEPARGLRPIVCIPETRLATDAARAMLPATVPLETVVETTHRSALVLAGLSGWTAWDPSAMTDDVHEPPRLAAMAGSRAVIGAARELGYGACLSGAGPSVLVVVDRDDVDAVTRLRAVTGDGWQVHATSWDRAGADLERRP